MNLNTHSTSAPAGTPGGLSAVAAELQDLAAQPRDGLADAARADRVMALRGLADRIEGHWLRELADVDARGAAGAEQGTQAPSTAGWLRARLRLSAAAASGLVRTARALYRGPLTATGQALAEGAISPAQPRCWPPAPRTCPPTSLRRPNRCCWTRLGAWTHPGCGG